MGEVRFGRWELRGVLGHGGLGVVHRAWDPVLAREVALKRLIRASTSPRAMARFEREAQAMARVAHPNLVILHEGGLWEGEPFLAMELLSGGSLQDRLRGGALSTADGLDLGVALAAGMAHLHGHGIVHRDVKPSNVLLGPHGPKLGDLGCARLLDDVRERMTRTGELVGTPAYMAPEQLEGDNDRVGPAADVYGLGATLFAALTGEPPFPGGGVQLVAKVLGEAPHAPGRGRTLDALILRCLAKDPAARPTAVELRDALARLRERGSLPGHRRRVLLLGGLLFATGALAVWQLRPSDRDTADSGPAARAAGPDTGAVSTRGIPFGPREHPTAWRGGYPPGRLPPFPLPEELEYGSEPRSAVNRTDGSVLLWVPPGRFRLGTPPAEVVGSSIPASPRQVELRRGFWIGRCEVTWAQWATYCEARGLDPRPHVIQGRLVGLGGVVPPRLEPAPGSPPHLPGPDEPAMFLTWAEAADYCEWAGLRLPTEIEWEYAARGDDARDHPWGSSWPQDAHRYLNLAGGADGAEYTARVGRYQLGASPWGCLDMVGNVLEWVEDWEDDYPGQETTLLVDPRPPEGPTPPRTPEDLDPSPRRMMRGGSWMYEGKFFFTVHLRLARVPDRRGPDCGFRVARDP